METIHIIIAVIFGAAVVFALACSLYFNVFEKEDSNGNKSGGGFWKFMLAVVLVILAFALLGMCSDGTPWTPRHT